MVTTSVPNEVLASFPHVSIEPVVDGDCAFTFCRLQSGMKFLLVSVHERVVLATVVFAGSLAWASAIGLAQHIPADARLDGRLAVAEQVVSRAEPRI